MVILLAENHYTKGIRHCTSSIMIEQRVVSSNWKSLGNRTGFDCSKLHLSNSVGHRRFIIVNSWLLQCYSECLDLQ